MGRKTTIVVNVEAVIAPPTSAVPLIAESRTLIPLSLFLNIFSITTMALSTSIPAPSASPPRVIMFMVRSLKYIKLKVAITEIGIATLTINVEPILRRNTKRITTASKIPIKAVCCTSPTASLMNFPWLVTCVSL